MNQARALRDPFGRGSFRRSRFLKRIDHPSGYTAVFHSFFGWAMLLMRPAADLLDTFGHLRFPFPAWDRRVAPFLRECIHRGFLVEWGKRERDRVMRWFDSSSKKGLSALGLVVAGGCNFRCHHCLHFRGYGLDSRPRSPCLMGMEMARRAVDWAGRSVRAAGGHTLSINFGGGEPLLNWEVVHGTLRYARHRFGSSLDLRFSINTNASLITDEMAKALRGHGVKVVTSLDGLPRANDSVRRTERGGPTFDLVWKAFQRLDASGIPIRALHVTLTSKNFPHLDEEFIHFLSEKGILSITLEPDLTQRLDRSVPALVEKVLHLRAAARKRGMTVTGYWEKPFSRIMGEERNAASHFCSAMGGEAVDVLPDGSVYGCSYTDWCLGRLEEFIGGKNEKRLEDSPRFLSMVESRRVGHLEGCRDCELEGVCAGGCYVTEAHAAKRGDRASTAYRCEFYRQVTWRLVEEAIERRTF